MFEETLFADADNDEPPVMLANVSWPEIKSFITARVEEYFVEQVGV